MHLFRWARYGAGERQVNDALCCVLVKARRAAGGGGRRRAAVASGMSLSRSRTIARRVTILQTSPTPPHMSITTPYTTHARRTHDAHRRATADVSTLVLGIEPRNQSSVRPNRSMIDRIIGSWDAILKISTHGRWDEGMISTNTPLGIQIYPSLPWYVITLLNAKHKVFSWTKKN